MSDKENEIEIKMKKFNIRDMDLNSKVAVIGKPGTGKSTLITDLLYQHRKRLPMGVIMSGTEESNGHYGTMVPDLYIYGEYNQPVIDEIVKRQKKAIRNKVPNAECFLVLDDCMDDKSWIKNKMTKGIFKNGRHWKLFFLLAMQYCMDIPPELRTCLDYIFILKENIKMNKKKLYEHYCGLFPNVDMFTKVLDSCTENYQCLVVKNRCISNQLEDVYFWYKADLHDDFKIGGPSFWNYAKVAYNDRYLEDDDESDLLNSKGAINNPRKFRKACSTSKKRQVTKIAAHKGNKKNASYRIEMI